MSSLMPNSSGTHQGPLQYSAGHVKSVKHLTCHYWATGGCKFLEHECLYAHCHTGKGTSAPIQVERGRPAVAGVNARNPRPIYKDWRRQRRHDGIPTAPRAMMSNLHHQIQKIHEKAASNRSNRPSEPSAAQTNNAFPSNIYSEPSSIADFYEHTPSAMHQIEACKNAAKYLGAALSSCQEASVISSNRLFTECGELLDVSRKVHGNGSGIPDHVDTLLHSLSTILCTAKKQKSNIATTTALERRIHDNLHEVGLGEAMTNDKEKLLVDEQGTLVEQRNFLV